MALSTALENLKNSLSCITYNSVQHSHILIEEHSSSSALSKITLTAQNGNWFSFNPDEGRKCKRLDRRSNLIIMSPLLTIDNHDYHCACDAVILVQTDTKLTIIYIELKSTNSGGYAKQFKSTRQFVHYALGLLEEFYEQKFTSIEERYIVFHSCKKALLNKMRTVPKTGGIGKTLPNQAHRRLVSDNAKLFLKELLA